MTIYKDIIQTDLVLAMINKQKKKVLFETKNNRLFILYSQQRNGYRV